MQVTIQLDNTNSKALAFLDFIKTLDFIHVDTDETIPDFALSKAQKAELDARKLRHQKNESSSHSWNEVKQTNEISSSL